jgi:hypothetical protein
LKLFAAIVASVLLSAFVQQPGDQPKMAFEPVSIITVPDSTGYVTKMINIRNTGGGTLTLTNVVGSCKCAGGSVQSNSVAADSTARVYLWINTQHFTDTINYVDFTIESNAFNSPAVFRVAVRKPKLETE